MLLASYLLLTLIPLIPGIPPLLGSLAATAAFAALSMALILALARLKTAAWQEALGLVVLLGGWWGLGRADEAYEHLRVYLSPATGLVFLVACVCAGKLLSRIIRDRNVLAPICVVAALADMYTVFAGPTGTALEQAPKLVQKLSVAIPQVGSAAGPTGHKGLAFVGTMGLGDFIFLAMFFAAAVRFGFRLRRSYLGVLIPTAAALVVFLLVPRLPGIPLLPFIALGFLVANLGEFRFSAEEKRVLKLAGLIVGVLVAAGVAVWAVRR